MSKRKLNISNIRMGFATNSSSSHSMIFIKDANKTIDDDINSDNFGWEQFTLVSPEMKMRYLGGCLFNSYSQLFNEHAAGLMVKDILGVDCSTIDSETGKTVYEYYGKNGVDHQSILTFPKSIGQWSRDNDLNQEFIEDIKQFILQDDLVILGGNDNDGDHHYLKESAHEPVKQDLPIECNATELFGKKDGDYWIIFNHHTGAKTRFSFKRNAAPYTKSSTPELVDIKITDHCPFGCPFCYQGSTHKGVHAEIRNIDHYISTMRDMEVFEVAIGGGEPTLHPEFVRIIDSIHSANMVPNFTTKNLAWFTHKNWAKIDKKIGAFAYSIGDHTDFKSLRQVIDDVGIERSRVNAQYVMGTQPSKDLTKIFNEAASQDIRLTLLGYKDVGFGPNFKKQPYSDWTDHLKKAHSKHGWKLKVSIDTTLALESQDELKNFVPDECYSVYEGKFSMYVDAVAGKIGPSSFCKPNEYVDLGKDDIDQEHVQRIYGTF